MRDSRVRLWSIFASAGLAFLTLFVFWTFQNYGPESAIRRFHSVIERTNTYIPPSLPFNEQLLKPVDRFELTNLSASPLSSSAERNLIDQIIRRALYAGARYSVQRLLFRSSREAVAVVLYEFPARENTPRSNGAAVFVLTKPRRTWQVNAQLTSELLQDMAGSRPGPF